MRHGVASDFEKAYLRHTREGTLAQFRFERTLPAAVVNALMDITTHVLRSMQQQAEKNPEYGIQPDSIPVSFCEALYLIESERKRES